MLIYRMPNQQPAKHIIYSLSFMKMALDRILLLAIGFQMMLSI